MKVPLFWTMPPFGLGGLLLPRPRRFFALSAVVFILFAVSACGMPSDRRHSPSPPLPAEQLAAEAVAATNNEERSFGVTFSSWLGETQKRQQQRNLGSAGIGVFNHADNVFASAVNPRTSAGTAAACERPGCCRRKFRDPQNNNDDLVGIKKCCRDLPGRFRWCPDCNRGRGKCQRREPRCRTPKCCTRFAVRRKGRCCRNLEKLAKKEKFKHIMKWKASRNQAGGRCVCTNHDCCNVKKTIQSRRRCCNSRDLIIAVRDDPLVRKYLWDPIKGSDGACILGEAGSGARTNRPTPSPTHIPTEKPTSAPTSKPTNQPTGKPAEVQTMMPTALPSSFPSLSPTSTPSLISTGHPSSDPTASVMPSISRQPASSPSHSEPPTTSLMLTPMPSAKPSLDQSKSPSSTPTDNPTISPSRKPSLMPSSMPTSSPSNQPSQKPSKQPSSIPSLQPSKEPTKVPSAKPSMMPSLKLSKGPSKDPSSQPSSKPSSHPSPKPSSQPSSPPTISSRPTASEPPSSEPSLSHMPSASLAPSSQPTVRQSEHPSDRPSSTPSSTPSSYPSAMPSSKPSSRPTGPSSLMPSTRPSNMPSSKPSLRPSPMPSSHPSEIPSVKPSLRPSDISQAPSSAWVMIGNDLLIECSTICPVLCLARIGTESLCCSGNITTNTDAWECPVVGPCGDGVINIGEECDDGNEINNDSCNNNCTLLVCGDGEQTDPEECDNGSANGPLPASNCSDSCVFNLVGCGNGTLEPGEECDDNNTISGDGCSSNCLNETCGNGRVDFGEECDLGLSQNNDPPSSTCTKSCTVYTAYCGDEIINSGEECDDGNFDSLDGCAPNCTVEPTFTPSAIPTAAPVSSDFPSLLPGPMPTPGNASAPTPGPKPCSPPKKGQKAPKVEDGVCVPPTCDCSKVPESIRFPLEVACNTATAVFDPGSLGSTVVVLTELAALAPKIMCRNLQIKDLSDAPGQDPYHYECVCDRQERFCNRLCICAWTIFKLGTKAGLVFLDIKYSMKEALKKCRDMGISE